MTVEAETALSEVAIGLRAALRRMPGAVALVTTRDPESDRPAGLAASAVIPVSMAPPSMLVAVNRRGRAHAAIERAGRFCVNLLGTAQTALVGLFSDGALRDRRFDSPDWRYADGIPWLPSACASIFCATRVTQVFGTHELFIGETYAVRAGDCGDAMPLGWLEGDFARLAPLE